MAAKPHREFERPRAHVCLTTGEVTCMLREVNEWTQQALAKRSGIKASNTSLLENRRVESGTRRVEQLANVFDVHASLIIFPEYESKEMESAA
jgi:transcriptional regulator with XRE-family HTH domain